jgi:hypothetical protein
VNLPVDYCDIGSPAVKRKLLSSSTQSFNIHLDNIFLPNPPLDRTNSVVHWRANFLASFSTDMQSGDQVNGFGISR